MKTKKTNGQSLIELAIVLPLLLLLVMGIFDLGRGIFYYSAIHNAAREGARYGAIDHCDTDGITSAAISMASSLGEHLTVDEPVKYYADDGAPSRIVVTVSYEFETITPMVGTFLGEDGKITLESQARQLIELPVTCSP
jgi:Flp pilus assembly protein TadG